MPSELSFAVVDQATNVAKKVEGYITAGMDTTIDIAQDVVEMEKESGKPKVKELQAVMMQYAEMEHNLDQFLEAVEHIKQQAKRGVDGPSLEKMLDQRLAEMQSTSPKPNFQEHVKYREMEEKIQDLATPDEEAATAVPTTQIDDDLAMTQADVNIKCPYTGQPMKNPVKNTHCGHNYDKAGIMAMIKNRGGRARCPVAGCINDKPVQVSDLEENKELKRIIEKKTRQEGKRTKKGSKRD